MTAANTLKPGSVAARAVAVLQGLHPDDVLSSQDLAQKLGIRTNAVSAFLDSALRLGFVARDMRGGNAHWRAGPNAAEAAPPPTPAPKPAEPADPEDDEDDDAAPIARTVPSATAAPIPGLVRQSWCPVAQAADPQSSGGEPVDAPPAPPPAAPKPPGLDWKAPRTPVFARDASAENTTPPASPAAGGAEAAPASPGTAPATAETQIVVEDFVRAARADRLRDELAPNEDFRCALWSNGMLEMVTTEGETILLNDADTRGLLRYVGDMLSARVRAGV